jgi:hypothetical protein
MAVGSLGEEEGVLGMERRVRDGGCGEEAPLLL